MSSFSYAMWFYISIVEIFIMIVLIILSIYKKKRKQYQVKVNCWFCNSWQKVDYYLRNGFKCCICEQYNGFKTNGDYNIILPAQYDSLMNVNNWSKPIKKKTRDPKFCYTCSVNQQLKIKQLSDFIPQNENNFDEEIQSFQMQLETAYKLCDKCDLILKNELNNQNQRLFGHNMKSFKNEKSQSTQKINHLVKRICPDNLSFILIVIIQVILEGTNTNLVHDFLSSKNEVIETIRLVLESYSIVNYMISFVVFINTISLLITFISRNNEKILVKRWFQMFLWILLMACESAKEDFYQCTVILKIIIMSILATLIFKKKNQIIKNILKEHNTLSHNLLQNQISEEKLSQNIHLNNDEQNSNKVLSDDLSTKLYNLKLRNRSNESPSNASFITSYSYMPKEQPKSFCLDYWTSLSRSSSQSSGFGSICCSVRQNQSCYQFPFRKSDYFDTPLHHRQCNSVL